jgi:hypothetical protein
MTGLSRSQIARLIGQFGARGTVKLRPSRRRKFPRRYTTADVALLAKVDQAHGKLSGPVTRRILQREYTVHFRSKAFIPTTGVRLSTASRPECYGRFSLNRPNRGPATPTITAWWNQKTAPCDQKAHGLPAHPIPELSSTVRSGRDPDRCQTKAEARVSPL